MSKKQIIILLSSLALAAVILAGGISILIVSLTGPKYPGNTVAEITFAIDDGTGGGEEMKIRFVLTEQAGGGLIAPIAAKNFIYLAQNKYYDDSQTHYLSEHVMKTGKYLYYDKVSVENLLSRQKPDEKFKYTIKTDTNPKYSFKGPKTEYEKFQEYTISTVQNTVTSTSVIESSGTRAGSVFRIGKDGKGVDNDFGVVFGLAWDDESRANIDKLCEKETTGTPAANTPRNTIWIKNIKIYPASRGEWRNYDFLKDPSLVKGTDYFDR